MNEINTQRLILRKFTEKDFNDYYNILKQQKVSRYLGTGDTKTKQEAKKILTNNINNFKDDGYGVYAVINKKTKKLIGHCGLSFFKDIKETELLYAYTPEVWGNGYATEAAKALIEFSKDKLKLKKLIALAYPQNKNSSNVLIKSGFIEKGVKEFFGVNLLYYEIELNK